MIGEYAKPGRRCEYKALLDAAVWKAFIFGLLVFAVCVERISARHGRKTIQHIGVWVRNTTRTDRYPELAGHAT